MTKFLFRTYFGISDILALVLSLLLVTWIISPLFYPASSWIVLHSVTVSDAVVGEEVKLRINRTLLKGTYYGRYEVDVRTYPQNRQVCTARRAVPYVVGSYIDIDKDVALDLWAYSTDRQCVDWEPVEGQYYIITRHCWKGAWWTREGCNPINTSNVFTVRD